MILTYINKVDLILWLTKIVSIPCHVVTVEAALRLTLALSRCVQTTPMSPAPVYLIRMAGDLAASVLQAVYLTLHNHCQWLYPVSCNGLAKVFRHIFYVLMHYLAVIRERLFVYLMGCSVYLVTCVIPVSASSGKKVEAGSVFTASSFKTLL